MRDIAVHFLEGDAHNWWLAVDKQTNGSLESFAEFEVEFNRKYFLAEAWDSLEAKFLDLVQGRRTVREYEEEFNRLRRFVGRELENEAVQVRRFIRGLRPELKPTARSAPSTPSGNWLNGWLCWSLTWLR